MINLNIWQLILTILGITSTFAVILLTYYVRIGQIRSKFDDKMRMIELDRLREHYESQINSLNNKMTNSLDSWKEMNHLVIAPNNNDVNYAKDIINNEPNTFLKSFGLSEGDITINPTSVFVLTPFSKEMRGTYHIIKNVCMESNLTCSRGDEELVSGEILNHIVKKIANSRVVIANLDGRNPNVFYELGIAHALNKPTILISKSIDHVPFDVKSKSIILYENSNDLIKKLQAALLKTIINT